MATLREARSARSSRVHNGTTLEQLSSEIIFEIFDYFTGNEICKSFYGLNSRFNQLVCNTPNVHLDLPQGTPKFLRTFQQIFCEQHIVSIILLYENAAILETLSISSRGKQLRSISLLDVPVFEFENGIPTLLSNFKDQLISLKIRFSDMVYTSPGERAAQSFEYLLTQMPLLKDLTLEYSKGIDAITFMPANSVNNTVVNLTIYLFDVKRLIPLLYRFQKLSVLKLYMYRNSLKPMKRAVKPQDIQDFRSRIEEKTSIAYPVRLRHVRVYHHVLVGLENFENLLQHITPTTLLTLSLLSCERSPVKIPIPRRQPPFLDDTQWHTLLRKYLPSTIKRFYIEYEDVDDSMSRTNPARVKKEFLERSVSNSSLELLFSYDKTRKYMSFDLTFT